VKGASQAPAATVSEQPSNKEPVQPQTEERVAVASPAREIAPMPLMESASPVVPQTEAPKPEEIKNAAPAPNEKPAENKPASASEPASSTQEKTESASADQASPKSPSTASEPSPLETAPPAAAPHVQAKPAVQGTMLIAFGTRSDVDDEGKPRTGSEDRYTVHLQLGDGPLAVAGTIKRHPLLLSSILGRELQGAGLGFDLKFLSGGKPTAEMTGSVPIDEKGVYVLSGGKLLMKTPNGRTAAFSGRIVGKSDNTAAGLANKLYEYARVIRGKRIKVQSKHIDPLEFKNVLLASGPQSFPESTVNGRLDYDYDTGNWLTSGLRIAYSKDGQKAEDTVSGSIRWVEDAHRDTNGRGEYQFNLRFNEPQKDESAYFTDAADEELFFAVDESVPSLTGSVAYIDTYGPSADASEAADDERPVLASKVTYRLESRGLTETQVMNFLKLWLLVVGPVNDE